MAGDQAASNTAFYSKSHKAPIIKIRLIYALKGEVAR